MAVVVALTLLLWDATGRAGWTKFHDPDRAQRDAQAAEGSLEDLFADAGIEGLPELENRFQLGLAPSGVGEHAASVLTIAGPAALVGLGSLASLAGMLRRGGRGETAGS
ncbi:MAG: hypothetical protein H6813_03200 [Phycisphaeraceae bacterium]|nr:hypothetical protein [Phycisphaeraceae bacterium]MCB9846952.1 hypothetical protein [Phycisphaeraceae bacterium]